MNTRFVYCDETGDDGKNTLSSDIFVLTSIYMPSEAWNENYKRIKDFRKDWKDKYGLHVTEEMHTKQFLTDKDPFRNYGWTIEQKQEMLKEFTLLIASLDIRIINTIIDKTKITTDEYNVLENALTYSVQRIENDSAGDWNYIIISDKGRISPMRKTARAIRAYNPIHSQFGGMINKPIKYLLEDVLEKDSKESYYIQICDFVSYFVHLFYTVKYLKKEKPKRVSRLIDDVFVGRVMATLRDAGVLNLKANSSNEYGLVIYPK
ncbi:DUF3800 domain-containing protein [Eubacterium ruminantium]|uniref:DUF3800 domain-containing protein n=1 Tax=Eubacterium ruminantium TaxID=42322 RepID=A0A1T4KS43_9FIRM|nr:DUF3800 domain-containing protein [Eubacterium ruminantium]SCW34358.1 Protein of unknown function [Eubacterium ruminantium]SDM32829.1 Protein of unknown function [Eubacterium ruminantium]SJZ45226.1 Protein of unknown function [Eubacterium ruminantium]